MKLWFAFLVLLVACTTPAPIPGDAAVRDAEALSPTSVEPPHVDVPPTPMPDWLVHPRPSLGWPEHDAPPVRAPVRKQPVLAAAGTRPPIIPPSWTVPAWFIDPVNGNDVNTCTTSSNACKTYAEIAARWGTYSPRLRQNTTLTWISSQPDNTDPVYWSPYVENGAIPQIIGTPTVVATISLASLTAKNRNTPQLLQFDLGASAAINQLVIDTTQAGSKAWVYKNVAGTTFALSQPLAAVTIPFSMTGTENNAWANADTATLNTLPSVDIVSIMPTFADVAVNSMLHVTNVSVMAGTGGASDAMHINGVIRFVECVINRSISYDQGLTDLTGARSGLFNTDVLQGINTIKHQDGSAFQITGGIQKGTILGSIQYDQDPISVGSPLIDGSNVTANVGMIYLETGATYSVVNGVFVANAGGGGPFIWGPGTFNVINSSHARYSGTAANIWINTGGIKINSLATACSHTGANNPDVVNCNITLSGSNLDAAQGLTGFGGNAFVLGGGSISTF